MEKRYRAALYCRLSREDGDRAESDSIVNQRHMLEDYCARDEELTVAGIFTDDGATGTNFERAGFRRMLDGIEAGELDCVIVKDLSRFGRDYIGMGWYLERYFPERGVRFIAVNDGVDSRNGPYSLLLPLKNLFNAQYARDASDKVRKALRAKQRRGEYTGAFAPYGYAKDPENRNRLMPDPEAAEVVRLIFARRADGMTCRAIADALNREGVPGPLGYKRGRGVRLHVGRTYRGPCLWSDAAIGRVLGNETYLGRAVSNRYPSDGMHGKSRLAAREEWIVVEGAHEPIVPRALWDAAHRKESPPARRGEKTERGLFRGLLRCGECGCALSRKGGGSQSYRCCAQKAYGRDACAGPEISEAFLASTVLEDLNRLLAHAGVWGDPAKRRAREARDGDAQRAGGLACADASARLMRRRQLWYEDYRDRRITREAYLRGRESCDRRERALAPREEPAALPEEAAPSWAERVAAAGRLAGLDRTTVERTVREIRVFDGGRVEIYYRFAPGQGV